MAVNLTNLTAIDSFYTWGKFAGDASGGLFWGVILIALFIIIVTRLRHNGIENAIMAASFSCLFLSIIFLNMNFVQLVYPIIFALFLAGTIFAKSFKPK